MTKTIGASLTIHYLVMSVSVVVTFDSLPQDKISEDVVPVVSIIIFLIWSYSIVQDIAFSIKSSCTCMYASCWGFISFKEEGFSRWRAGTPLHTRAFVIEPLLSKDGYCAQFYIILLSIHDHHNFQVTVFDAMIFIKNFHSVNVIQKNLDRSDAPSAQSGDECVECR